MNDYGMSVELRFILAALANWRISFLLVREDGPWGMMASLRRIGGRGFTGRMLECVKCTGIWVSIPFTFFVSSNVTELVVVWVGVSGSDRLN